VVVVFIVVGMLASLALVLALVLSLCPAYLSFSIARSSEGTDFSEQLPNDDWVQSPPHLPLRG
jgi:hypothetical protein